MIRNLAAVALVLLVFAPLGARAQSGASQLVSGRRIATLAARKLAIVPHATDLGFVPVSIVPDQILALGRITIHAGTPQGSTAFVNVPVRIDLDGRLNRTVMVGYRVQRYISTAVAAHDLAPGSVLTAADLIMARAPYSGAPGNGISALLGRKTEEAVLKGEPVTLEATAVNQIVQAGSTVVFVVRDAGVEVSADAIARTGGGLGDEVFVYNPSTHKALSGTVTAPGTVELDISGGTP